MDGPRRTCVGCRRVRPKSELTRIVRGPSGAVAVDRTGSAPGRGAYVCGRACARQAAGRIAKALRAPGLDGRMLECAVAEATGEEA